MASQHVDFMPDVLNNSDLDVESGSGDDYLPSSDI